MKLRLQSEADRDTVENNGNKVVRLAVPNLDKSSVEILVLNGVDQGMRLLLTS